MERLPEPRALLLDMDGTITEPMLDFPAIKREMGIGDIPILEALAEMRESARRAAEVVLLRHEEAAAETSTLNLGCADLLAWAEERGIALALITRNSTESVATVVRRHGLRMDAVVSREDGPFKPDPAAVRLALARLGGAISADEAWMVGDGRFDVEAGIAAGCRTVWVSHGRAPLPGLAAWRTVRDLPELLCLLRSCSDLRSSLRRV